jgi:hypothetical protein
VLAIIENKVKEKMLKKVPDSGIEGSGFRG